MFDLLDWLPFYGNFITGFSLGGKKKGGGIQTYNPPAYSGPVPFEAGAVGYGADKLKSLADAYLPELQRRAMGQGLVGFDPSYRQTLRSEFLKDFGDYEGDVYAKASEQASGQGLRGGTPLSIRQDYQKGLGRAREAGLADIDIRDLEARREDINQAFYQQPQEVQRGAGIQQNAANFGLQQYEATKPIPYIQQKQQSILPSLIGAGATLGGSLFGGPFGAIAGNSLAKGFNKSFLPSGYQDPYGGRSLASIFRGGY